VSPVDFLAAGWCLPVIMMDLKRRRVRWWWSLAGLAAAIVHRLVIWVMEGISFPELFLITLVSAASWRLWKQSVWGGADAKTAMTLVLVQPGPGSLLAAGMTLFLAASLGLAWRRWRGVREPGWSSVPAKAFPTAAFLCLGMLIFFAVRAVAGTAWFQNW
jgi:hypothetical protein